MTVEILRIGVSHNLFAGLAQTWAWNCFEFSRLNRLAVRLTLFRNRRCFVRIKAVLMDVTSSRVSPALYLQPLNKQHCSVPVWWVKMRVANSHRALYVLARWIILRKSSISKPDKWASREVLTHDWGDNQYRFNPSLQFMSNRLNGFDLFIRLGTDHSKAASKYNDDVCIILPTNILLITVSRTCN